MNSALDIFSVNLALQLFCHNVEATNVIFCIVKINVNGNSENFIDLQKKADLVDLVYVYSSYTLKLL